MYQKWLAADGHKINCRTCRYVKTCNVAIAHCYWVGACVEYSPDLPMIKNYPPYMDHPKERKKQTNADIIRHMSNEELSQFLCDMAACNADACEQWTGNCFNCWLDWLKREVC